MTIPNDKVDPRADAVRGLTFIDVRTLAGMLGVDRSTVWRKAAAGLLPRPIKVAGLTRWRLADVEAALAGPEGAEAA